MASPNTLAFRKGVEDRAAIVREEVEKRYAVSHRSLPRTSSRHMGQNKGDLFSRHILKQVITRPKGLPDLFVLKHPTGKWSSPKTLAATPQLVSTFFPSLPAPMVAAMLGH
jgi:hypothetical protein